MPVAPTLKAVFFDAAGTLIHLSRSVGQNYRDVALRHGLDLPADALDLTFRQCWKEMPAKPNSQGPRPDDDKNWWRDLVGRLLDRLLPEGANPAFDRSAYFESLYAHFAEPGVWSAYPEAAEVLRALRGRGLRLAVISNFDRRLYPVLDSLGLTAFFDRIVISSEVGSDKPDPAIFKKALALLNVEPGEAIHVGDDPKCDWGARTAGLGVFELERPAHSLQDLPGWLDTGRDRQNDLASGGILS